MISANDTSFKLSLDRYKYADSHAARTDYRAQGAVFLQQLEERLRATRYLLGNTQSIADAGIFPFIRQFAEVDKEWFAQAPYPLLRTWLAEIVDSPRFAAIMQKHPIWQPG